MNSRLYLIPFLAVVGLAATFQVRSVHADSQKGSEEKLREFVKETLI